jgi:hypothetical protein
LLVGSVKTGFGHAEYTSGLMSICKMILSMQRGLIPKNLHFVTPNPFIAGLAVSCIVCTEKLWNDAPFSGWPSPGRHREHAVPRRLHGDQFVWFRGLEHARVSTCPSETSSDSVAGRAGRRTQGIYFILHIYRYTFRYILLSCYYNYCLLFYSISPRVNEVSSLREEGVNEEREGGG